MAVSAERIIRPSRESVFENGEFLRARGYEITSKPTIILPPNPDRLEAFLFNNGGPLELPVDLGVGDRTGAALPASVVIDSASIQAPAYATSSFKTFVLLVDTALAWAAGGQASVQLIVGRNAWSPAAGATTATGGASNNFLKGAAANLGGAAATSLAVGIWPFSPVDLPDLQWQWGFVGLELKFPSALTAGSARLLLDMPGGPLVLLGTDENVSRETGDRANSYVLLPGAPSMRITSRRAIYAATPAGIADLRVWENVRGADADHHDHHPAVHHIGG